MSDTPVYRSPSAELAQKLSARTEYCALAHGFVRYLSTSDM
ncbi:hypothetical protein ACH4TV_13070 [Streptomyces sp. NPDC020898]